MSFKNVLPIFILIGGLISCNTNKTNSTDKKDVLAANMDTTVNPADDFFDYANGGWIKNNPIPEDQSSWGIASLVIQENQKRLKEIAENAAKANAAAGTADQKIGDFWKTAMDSVKIEQQGIQPIQSYLDKINALTDVPSLQKAFADLAILGIDGPISFSIGQDAKNSTINALQLWQTGLGLPDRDYYFKTDAPTQNIRIAYVKHIAKMLTLLGEDTTQSAKDAQAVMAMETKMAGSHRKLEDLRDPYSNYNKFAVTDLGKVSNTIDWKNYMQIFGVNKADSVIIGQPEYYTEAGKLITSEPINTWKAYLKYRLAQNFAGALPEVFGQESFDFTKLFSGAKVRQPRWKRAINNEEDAMGELLGQLYVKKYFDEKTKQRYSDLVENIRSTFKEHIEKLDWMSDSTKQKALAKLAAIHKKVGYPDKWKDFSSLKIGTESYVANLIQVAQFWHNYEINKLGKPVNKDEWDMYPQTYNAYYDPSNNEIVLPAGIFTVPGYMDNELDDATVYGYAASSTIGHEITHGFDDEGRQYDAQGNLKNWWSKQDEENFNARAKRMIDQFSGYMPVDSMHINGKATLGENIADLGGIVLGWDAFKKTDQYKNNQPIAGLSPSQRFFLGYALGWLGHTRDESLRSSLLTDVHSPAKFRVNGPFSDVDAFYETFHVMPNNKMYIPDSLRVRIW
ncbi:MAG: M13 family metallopeptidase [Bacteroidetes bacterium]|nr:M13 family metallopeptidase [Bacteroidota bacterium]